jgi:isopenicillin N synthase-like dioxygenase
MNPPVVDFGKFLNGSAAEKRNAAKEIDGAFRDLGFVYLKNHGVPQEKVDDCFNWVGL